MNTESVSPEGKEKLKEIGGGISSIAFICAAIGLFSLLLAFGFNKLFGVEFGTALLSGSILSSTTVMMSFLAYIYSRVDAWLRAISTQGQQNGISVYNISVLLAILLERAGLIATSVTGINNTDDTELH